MVPGQLCSQLRAGKGQVGWRKEEGKKSYTFPFYCFQTIV